MSRFSPSAYTAVTVAVALAVVANVASLIAVACP